MVFGKLLKIQQIFYYTGDYTVKGFVSNNSDEKYNRIKLEFRGKSRDEDLLSIPL